MKLPMKTLKNQREHPQTTENIASGIVMANTIIRNMAIASAFLFITLS